jgi:hypothetical protein
MPKDNPTRRCQGGSVPGYTKSAATNGRGIDVAVQAFDPGYSLETTFEGGDERNRMSQADLIRGYVATGRLIGH